MTFYYMVEVGEKVYTENPKSEEWDDMTPAEVGMNAIKQMLYYLPLRPLTVIQIWLAAQIYNIYSFGYPLGLDHGRKFEMLWWEKGKLVPSKVLTKGERKRKVSE